jgi:hypothetical protein
MAPQQLVLDQHLWPTADGDANSILTTNGDGVLSFAPAPNKQQFIQSDFIGVLANGTRSLIRSAPASTIESITVQTRAGAGVVSFRLNSVDVPGLVELAIDADPSTFAVPIVLAEGDVLKWYKHSGDLDSVYISYLMVLDG